MAAAAAVAAGYGVASEQAVVIHSGSNVLVHLRPAPVVARVMTGTVVLHDDPSRWLKREVSVLEFLAPSGMAVAPSPLIAPGPHHHDGLWMTFTEWIAGVEPVTQLDDADRLGRALRDLHDELRPFAGDLGDLRAVREDIERLHAQLRADGAGEANAICSLRARLDALGAVAFESTLASQALHGDVSLGNLLRTPQRLVWNDFEDTFRGPVQWDLASCVESLRIRGASSSFVREMLDAYGFDDEQDLAPFIAVQDVYVEIWQMYDRQRRRCHEPPKERSTPIPFVAARSIRHARSRPRCQHRVRRVGMIKRGGASAKRRWWNFVEQRMRVAETIASVRGRRLAEFDELVETVRGLGTDRMAMFGDDYAFEGGLRLQQRTNEIAALLLYLRERGPHGPYLEIGTASGGTTKLIQTHLNSEQVLTIDDGRHPDARLQDANLGAIPNLARYTGDSHASAARDFITDNLSLPLGVAFIDGDHSYDGVLRDTTLVLSFARPGALLIYHDTVAVRDVRHHWRKGAAAGLFAPVAHFVDDRAGALGIGVAEVHGGLRLLTALRNFI